MWLLTAMCAAAVSLSGYLNAAEENLPAASAILDRYAQVTGGRAGFDRLTNRLSKATLAMPKQGIRMAVTIYAAKPNKMYSVIESEELGRIEKGTDGNVVWEKSAMTGPVIKEGGERAAALCNTTFDRLVYWRNVYQKAECVGIEPVSGRPCYKVVATPASDASDTPPQAQTFYFDQQSSLLVRSDLVLESPAGTIPIRAYLSDYRQVDGVLLAHKVTTKVLGQERVLTTESIQHNVRLPADRFDLPQDVKDLAKSMQRNP